MANEFPHACVSGSDESLAAAAKAIAHPARLAILRAVGKNSRCNCGDICGQLPLAQSTVSQHLRVLKEAGFIIAHSEGVQTRYMVDSDRVETFVSALGALAEGLCQTDAICCNELKRALVSSGD